MRELLQLGSVIHQRTGTSSGAAPIGSGSVDVALDTDQGGSNTVAAAGKLTRLGAVLEDISARAASSASASCVDASAPYFQFRGLETARLPWSNSNSRKLFPSTKNTLINGLYPSAKFLGLYSKTLNIGRQIRDVYQRVFDKCDVIIPTTPFVAPRHADWKRHEVLESFEPIIWLTTNTAVFPVTGHPGISPRRSRPIHVYIVITQPPLVAKTSKTFNILRDYR
ncbi:uncharacterized protein G6M90_00g032420 [Metarhizium brunneum]|uniref:Uncharacterized protein n=1 Tax=Metarhizium brunneum TaxID=500148 RepID=A0A7D5UVY3_9HYPO|nr:hypothetical protein G6M90_00g032420 [Metarhizium brunneum]